MELPDEKSALYIAVGFALDAWSGVERALEAVFACVSGADLHRSHIIMGSIRSLETRLMICTNLIAAVRLNRNQRDFWKRCCERIKAQYRKRSELAHFSIVENISIDNTNIGMALVPYHSVGSMALGVVHRATGKHQMTALKTEGIVGRAKEFGELTSAVNWYAFELQVALGMTKENLMPTNAEVQSLLRRVALAKRQKE